jgi:hypothetical protein
MCVCLFFFLCLQNSAVKRNGFEAFISPSQTVKDGTKAKLAVFSSKEVSKRYGIKSHGFQVTRTIEEQKYLMLLMTTE